MVGNPQAVLSFFMLGCDRKRSWEAVYNDYPKSNDSNRNPAQYSD
jgi:hypothetical protein